MFRPMAKTTGMIMYMQGMQKGIQDSAGTDVSGH